MSVQIKYDGSDPFDGLPIPFVERGIEYLGDNATTGAIESITLTGQIPASGAENCEGFDYLIDEQTSLLNHFSQSFKKFEIIEDAVVVLSHENVKVESISFDGSNYASILDYSINLSVFRGDFLENAGVSNVSDSLSYQEGDNQTLEISHEVSAIGIRDSDSSSSTTTLEKARNFVFSQIGGGSTSAKGGIDISPVFFNHKNLDDDEVPVTPTSTQIIDNIRPALISFSENIDRLRGSYSVSMSYVCDLYFQSEGLLRYSIEIDETPENYVTVKISGDISYEEDLSGADNFDKLESRFKSFDFYGAAKRASGQDGLRKIPIERSVSKESSQNKIQFSFSYDTNPNYVSEGGTEKVISFGFDNDSDFVTIDVSGSIGARLGVKNKWEVAKKAFDDLDILGEAKAKYENYVRNVLGYTQIKLEKMPFNSNILSERVTLLKHRGQVSFQYSFDNFSQTPDNDIFKDFNYTIDMTHPVSEYVSAPMLNNEYIIQDLGCSERGVKTISGSALKKAGVDGCDAIDATISFINSIKGEVKTETQRQVAYDGNSTISFSFAWSTPDSVTLVGGSTDGVAPSLVSSLSSLL